MDDHGSTRQATGLSAAAALPEQGLDLFAGITKTACLSECGRYRSSLGRSWDNSKEAALFIMLNPSTADASVDDPTIRRCMGFARRWNLGGILVVNLFQLRATDPAALLTQTDLNPPGADDTIANLMAYTDTVIAAWGALSKRLSYRAAEVAAIARKRDKRLYHLGLTKDGSPRHPLYLRGDASPELYQVHAAAAEQPCCEGVDP